MKTPEISFTGNTLVSVVLGILATILVLTTLAGRKIPFIPNDRIALIVLVVLGMAMCASSIFRVSTLGEWTHPLSILSYLIGTLILVITITFLIGKPVPLISTTQQAILAVALLSATKLVLSILHRFLF